MPMRSSTPYPLGDMLALARQSWLSQMASRLASLGYPDFRRSDSAALRLLRRGPASIGELGTLLGVTRQAGRKVADGLQQRGFATTNRDALDSRQVNVSLTPAGREYAGALAGVIEELNREVAGRVDADDLAAADRVLRAAMFDRSAQFRAGHLPRPEPR
jgi:DNA-binding MarR family transcriptional regulator